MHFLRILFTEDDANQVWCPVRVAGGVGVIAMCLLSGAHAVLNHIFDPNGFGVGFAAIVGATGLGTGIKAKWGG